MNVILIGLPGCGKSAMGRRIAKKKGLNFTDIDRLIEELYLENHNEKLSCREIFKKKGEHLFRALECEIIKRLIATQKSVIALGGGALENPINQAIVKNIGYCIYLSCDDRVIQDRLKDRGIPVSIDPKKLEETFTQRCKAFETCADATIDVSKFHENDVETKLLEILNGE